MFDEPLLLPRPDKRWWYGFPGLTNALRFDQK